MKIALIIAGILLFLLIAFVAYYGGFKSVKVSVTEAGGEVLVYENIKGNYQQSGEVMDKIYYSLLEDEKIETTLGFGVYYDNPREVEEANLRSEAGCVLDRKDFGRIDELKKKYLIRIFPKNEYITAEFPFKNKMSIFFSIMKVYPALNKFAKKNGYDTKGLVMEVYDIPNHKTLYRKEIVRKNK